MLIIHPADAAQTIQGFFITNVTTQGIGGICGIGGHRPLANHIYRLFHQTRLWIDWV